MGGVSPGLIVLGGIRGQVEQDMRYKPVTVFFPGLCIRCCL